jgi:heat shock protein HslJ
VRPVPSGAGDPALPRLTHHPPMGGHLWVRLLLVVSVGVALSACGEAAGGSEGASADPPDLEQSLTAHEWLLDAADSSLEGAGTSPITLNFDGATAASGTAPCNTYRGAVTLDGDHGVRIDDIATTLMSCQPNVMAAERAYLTALAQVQTADVADQDRLVLTSDAVRLSFTAVDPEELLVGNWALTGVQTGDAIQSMVLGTEPVARFGADGGLTIETGCNTLSTTWELDGQDLTIEQPAGTMKTCGEPAGVMDQEAAIAAALPAVSTLEVTPTTLSLLDDAGRILLSAQRA